MDKKTKTEKTPKLEKNKDSKSQMTLSDIKSTPVETSDFDESNENSTLQPEAEKTADETKKIKKAQEMASKQREISVAEFFEKNRHLLGFDQKKKSLLTAIKEAVDNALDACEEAGILPEIHVEIINIENDRFRLIVEDNGPGIVREQIPKIFAKLLYGSKFHSLKQSRGQQGIGISASVMYGQLTTGKPSRITSKISPTSPAHYFELKINTATNQPEILADNIIEWHKEHGTRIEIDLEAAYIRGAQSVDEYIKNTAITNPHTTIIYTNPKAEQFIFPRVTDMMPIQQKEIKPHPYGIEIGMLIKKLQYTEYKNLNQFLVNEFSRVSQSVAKEICEKATILPNTDTKTINRDQAERIIKAIQNTKIIAPPTDCLSPITAELLEKGLKKEINAEFYTSITRTPEVYRGNPFIIEAAIAYGGAIPADKTVQILRFANRVPLLYQQGACAVTEAISDTNWRPYGLSQSQNSLPVGPCVIVVHMASVWVPFTSEAKEALAHYPEIIKEIKLAIQECGRKLASYVNKKKRIMDEGKKRSYIEKYLPHVGIALQQLLHLSDTEKQRVITTLEETLEASRGKLDEIGENDFNEEESYGHMLKGDDEEMADDSEDEQEE